MSLLLSEGHPHARYYPIQYAWSEARLARRRYNHRAVQEAFLMQAVVATALGGKKAGKNLEKLIKKVQHSD